tara:strand:- start:2595 stop:3224 length:630 start_codon:yes stop_codon:yes gene_type:complete
MNKNLIKTLIDKPDPIILDVGSFDGEDSNEFASVMPDCKIYAFEADPASLESFKAIGHPKQVELVELAVCNIDGEIDWYSSEKRYGTEDWSLSSSLKKPHNHLNHYPVSFSEDPITVNATKLDSWVEDNLGDQIIDFIWCDVNGAEEEFILGGIKSLQEKTRYLYTEYFDNEMWAGQVKLDWITEKLSNFEKIEEIGHNVLLKNKKLDV